MHGDRLIADEHHGVVLERRGGWEGGDVDSWDGPNISFGGLRLSVVVVMCIEVGVKGARGGKGGEV